MKDNTKTFISLMSYWRGVKEYKKNNPHQRWGQSACNYLYEVRPDLSNKIRGSSIDPFYLKDADGGNVSFTDKWIDFKLYVNRHWYEDYMTMHYCSDILLENIPEIRSNCDLLRRVENWDDSRFARYCPNNNWNVSAGAFCYKTCRTAFVSASEQINVLLLKLEKCSK